MSEGEQSAVTTLQEQYEQSRPKPAAAPLEPEQDTDPGTPSPEESEDAKADGAEATTETDEDTEDTGDGTPEGEDDSDPSGYESRYKELQATYTQVTQELSQFKEDYARQIDSITQAEQRAVDQLEEAEQAANALLAPIQSRLQQLSQMNAQSMTQEQYTQWQREYNGLQQQARHFGQLQAQAKQRSEQVRKQSTLRQREHDDRVLAVLIPDFDQVKGDLVAHAKALGWPESTIYQLKDPHILKLLNDSRLLAAAPDAVEELVTKTPAKRHPASGAKSARPQPKTLAERLYGRN